LQANTYLHNMANMKRRIFLAIVSFLFLVNVNGYAQDNFLYGDSIPSGNVSLSIFNVRPILLNKGQLLFSFQTALPNYYKSFSSATGKPEKLPSYMVLSEAYFNGYITYGLTQKWNLFLTLPFNDIHHFSPMGEISGVGVGDIETGVDYQLFGGNQNSENSLATRLSFGFPTGHYQNLSKNDYPLGSGSFRFQAAISGIHWYNKIQMIYSAYYEFRTNRLEINTGDEAGAYLIFRKPLITPFGSFGLEGGTLTYWNFADKKNGTVLPNTRDYNINLYAGAWFQYLKKFNLRFGIPYSVFQNKSWMTQYRIMLQIDYLLK